MSDTRTNEYARRLSLMIQAETVSAADQSDKTKFYRFHELLRELFPSIFAVCEAQDFDGSFLLRWRGRGEGAPILLMNHHDVVEASGEWKYPAFSGEIAEGRIWGRGTLDTKGGLWAMLQAADELAAEGYAPARDIYFMSGCNEETTGAGADAISKALAQRGMRFAMVLDEGGMIVREPIGGAMGDYAMIGVGEKAAVDLKFIARSRGGHASTPTKDTPLVRLGKFMAAVDKNKLFRAEMSDTVCDMMISLSSSMKGVMRLTLGHPRIFKPLLIKVMPMVSSSAGAMLRTTVAFTMAGGSEGTNVLPEAAFVVANMRCAHHQREQESVELISKLAEKFDIETVVLSHGEESGLSDHKGAEFAFLERGVARIFPDVRTSPYVMMAASDSRYMSRVSDNCFRFAPFRIDNDQMSRVHGIDENVNLDTLAPAVDFYRYVLTEDIYGEQG